MYGNNREDCSFILASFCIPHNRFNYSIGTQILSWTEIAFWSLGMVFAKDYTFQLKKLSHIIENHKFFRGLSIFKNTGVYPL